MNPVILVDLRDDRNGCGPGEVLTSSGSRFFSPLRGFRLTLSAKCLCSRRGLDERMTAMSRILSTAALSLCICIPLLAGCASAPPPSAPAATDPVVRAKGGDGEALMTLRAAAERGDGAAAFAVGLGLAEGWQGTADISAAIEWWRRAADRGNADAMNALAVACAQGIVDDCQLGAAREMWERAAREGNVTAQYNLGSLLATTAETRSDMSAAIGWLTQAADQGDADAQYFLGNLYANGEGVSRQPEEAERLWQQAAAQGHAEAAFNLAEAHLQGRFTAVDVELAHALMRRAAEQGSGEAAEKLALMDQGIVPPVIGFVRPSGGMSQRLAEANEREEPILPRFKTAAGSRQPAPIERQVAIAREALATRETSAARRSGANEARPVEVHDRKTAAEGVASRPSRVASGRKDARGNRKAASVVLAVAPTVNDKSNARAGRSIERTAQPAGARSLASAAGARPSAAAPAGKPIVAAKMPAGPAAGKPVSASKSAVNPAKEKGLAAAPSRPAPPGRQVAQASPRSAR